MAVDILTASRLKKMPEGKHSDGRGLYFFVRGDSRTWSLRYTDPYGRRREMSLGVYPDVSLSEARERRDKARSVLADGNDPQTVRKDNLDRTIAALTGQAFEAIRGDLKDGGAAGRWMSPVKTHILPKLGGVDVTTLTAKQVRDVLAPIWRTKAISVISDELDAGNAQTAQWLIDRIRPPGKSDYVDLPALHDGTDIQAQCAEILRQVADGELSLQDARAVQDLLARHAEFTALEAIEHMRSQLAELQNKSARAKPKVSTDLVSWGAGVSQISAKAKEP